MALNFVIFVDQSNRTVHGHEIETQTQDVDVLAVLDFEIPCSRPETPGFHPKPLFLKYEGHDENKNLRND